MHILALLILSSLVPPVNQPETSWVLTGKKAVQGKTFEAFLAIGKGTGASKKRIASIVSSPDVKVWFARDGRCNKDDKPREVPSSLLKVCAKPNTEAGFVLVASISSDNPKAPAQIIASDVVDIYSSRPLDSTWMTIIAAVLGFLAGILGEMGKKAGSDLLTNLKTRQESIGIIVKTLAPEVIENIKKIKAYIDNPQSNAPILSVGAFEALSKSDGVMSFLEKGDRKSYFANFEAVNKKVGDYNLAALTTGIESRILLEKAREAATALEKWQGT